MAYYLVCPRLCDKPAFKDVYSVMNNWGANHGAISYGHIGQDLITLASMLRIPVCMHNVEEDKCSARLHGMPSVWIRKEQTIELVQPTVLSTNNFQARITLLLYIFLKAV